VGTPGRICRLLEIGALVPKNISTLVLDEADHLMSDSFIRDIRCVQTSDCLRAIDARWWNLFGGICMHDSL